MLLLHHGAVVGWTTVLDAPSISFTVHVAFLGSCWGLRGEKASQILSKALNIPCLELVFIFAVVLELELNCGGFTALTVLLLDLQPITVLTLMLDPFSVLWVTRGSTAKGEVNSGHSHVIGPHMRLRKLTFTCSLDPLKNKSSDTYSSDPSELLSLYFLLPASETLWS